MIYLSKSLRPHRAVYQIKNSGPTNGSIIFSNPKKGFIIFQISQKGLSLFNFSGPTERSIKIFFIPHEVFVYSPPREIRDHFQRDNIIARFFQVPKMANTHTKRSQPKKVNHQIIANARRSGQCITNQLRNNEPATRQSNSTSSLSKFEGKE